MSFDQLGLSKPLLRAISEKGYTEPTPIQLKAIPEVLKGRDVLASAQTGTGKTAGFVLPMLHLLTQEPPQRKRNIRALILTPTRELAAQILENAVEYGKHLDVRSMVIFGGVNQNPQVRALRNGVDILIATPGRLLDLHQQGELSLRNVEFFVLDEADRMLDMGFARDINRIMDLVPKQRQNLLFSATFSKEIKRLANGILNNPVAVEATPENTTAEKVDQRVYRVDKGLKTAVTIKLIKEENWSQALIFTRTKHGANKLCEKLEKAGIRSAAIHGNKSQNHRTKTLEGFKAGKIQILVATDIAARGLDIPLLPNVMNFELPNVPEDYVHRIGRTGRAGASGEAVSLVDIDEVPYLRSIEKLLGESMPGEVIVGFEPTNTPTKNIDKKKKNFRRPGADSNDRRKPKPRSNKSTRRY